MRPPRCSDGVGILMPEASLHLPSHRCKPGQGREGSAPWLLSALAPWHLAQSRHSSSSYSNARANPTAITKGKRLEMMAHHAHRPVDGPILHPALERGRRTAAHLPKGALEPPGTHVSATPTQRVTEHLLPAGAASRCRRRRSHGPCSPAALPAPCSGRPG